MKLILKQCICGNVLGALRHTNFTQDIKKQNWDELVDIYKILEDWKVSESVECQMYNTIVSSEPMFESWQSRFQLLSFQECKLNVIPCSVQVTQRKSQTQYPVFFPKLSKEW